MLVNILLHDGIRGHYHVGAAQVFILMNKCVWLETENEIWGFYFVIITCFLMAHVKFICT